MGDHHDMGSALHDNGILCTRTLRHEGMYSWRDDLVGAAIDEPGGNVLPCWCPGCFLECYVRHGTLCRGHELGLLLGNISREYRPELVLLDIEIVGAVRERNRRGQRVREDTSREFAG